MNEITNIYDIAVWLLGNDLPQQFRFAYIIVTLVIAIAYIIVVLAPFIFIYKWFKE